LIHNVKSQNRSLSEWLRTPLSKLSVIFEIKQNDFCSSENQQLLYLANKLYFLLLLQKVTHLALGRKKSFDKLLTITSRRSNQAHKKIYPLGTMLPDACFKMYYGTSMPDRT